MYSCDILKTTFSGNKVKNNVFCEKVTCRRCLETHFVSLNLDLFPHQNQLIRLTLSSTLLHRYWDVEQQNYYLKKLKKPSSGILHRSNRNRLL